ncbi:MAG TPA: division/cell wall cluster transcriptional repressor MraZ [Thiobacillaceae bacterium]|jgi:MraZ protein|nr:division/cell wall cluster transcriptional repressor MraZ [Thiobacillaceae bacterium]HNF89299.1 division/cell wall cluster transcriptional repressor MraZ [Thiobacillaceae bacterium]HNH87884.1 division/cell wall cluster transcriptional repressor MraZ [Thiobacillaceae bacterium]HNI08314.1 division/cell wall cluster transcriptional repressor MraZ [Thiobacillaceae bacterium]HNL23071.1 division/cell wall cluster transcriptional repressor MraZ [Rhodocyclaceae bacterium]
MFRGSTLLALDGKGRVSIPAKYRERLSSQCGGRLMLTVDPTNGCLLLYPYPEFEALERHINDLPGLHPLTQQLKLLVVGSAEDVEPDSAGRILIAPVLRKFAKLEKGVMFVGQGNKFAIWSEAAWQARLEAAAQLPDRIAEAVANGTLPEELKGFTL